MKVHFKKQVNFNGKLLKGLHDLPAEHKNHWYLKALEKDGHIEFVEEPAIEMTEVTDEPGQLDADESEKVDEPALDEADAASEDTSPIDKEVEKAGSSHKNEKHSQKQSHKKGR